MKLKTIAEKFMDEHQNLLLGMDSLRQTLEAGNVGEIYKKIGSVQTRVYTHCANENAHFKKLKSYEKHREHIEIILRNYEHLPQVWNRFQIRWLSEQAIQQNFASFRLELLHLIDQVLERVEQENIIYQVWQQDEG